jgi:integrase
MEFDMKVHLREAKPDKKGRVALYLEYYYGYAVDTNGKIKTQRKRKNTGIYLVSKPKSKLDREMNKELRIKAEAIKSRAELDIINGTFQFDSKKEQGDFIQFFRDVVDDRKHSGHSTYYQYNAVYNHFIGFIKSTSLPFDDVTTSLCNDFKSYLLNEAVAKKGDPLASKSINGYLSILSSVFELAVRDDLMKQNPMKNIKKVKAEQNEREYLTADEMKELFISPCKYNVSKRAFLFACLTGLRFSDVRKLRWYDIKEDNGNVTMVFSQQKTKGLQYLPLSNQAVDLLGDRADNSVLVFNGLQSNNHVNQHLSKWIETTSIQKHITFHVARHTHALLLLSNDVPIYTVSKILGHSDVKTTQIYAHILDRNVKDAISSIPEFSF